MERRGHEDCALTEVRSGKCEGRSSDPRTSCLRPSNFSLPTLTYVLRSYITNKPCAGCLGGTPQPVRGVERIDRCVAVATGAVAAGVEPGWRRTMDADLRRAGAGVVAVLDAQQCGRELVAER